MAQRAWKASKIDDFKPVGCGVIIQLGALFCADAARIALPLSVVMVLV